MRDWLADRLVSAVLGALFGALIGAAVAWIATYGGHHAPRIVAEAPADFPACIRTGALVFGGAGLLLGNRAGDLVGQALGALMGGERPPVGPPMPRWLVLVVIICTAVAVGYFARPR